MTTILVVDDSPIDRRLASGPMKPETEAAGPGEQIQNRRLL